MAVVKKADKTIDLENQAVVFAFSNGKVVKLELGKISDVNRVRLALHGASQKAGDSYAGDETVEDAIKSCESTIQDLYNGNWSTRSVGSPRSTLLAQAISRISKADIKQVVAQLEAMEEEKVKAIAKHPQIKAMINTIKGEKLAAESAGAPDLNTLFASMGSSPTSPTPA